MNRLARLVRYYVMRRRLRALGIRLPRATRVNRLVQLVRYYVMRRRARALGLTLPLFPGRRQQEPPAARSPSWRLTILAEVDEKQGLIRPTAIITGTPLGRGRVSFDVLSESGRVGPAVEKSLSVEEPSSVLALPSIPLPEGAASDDVTSWRWLVRLENEERVLAIWSKRLVSAGALNCEAELDS